MTGDYQTSFRIKITSCISGMLHPGTSCKEKSGLQEAGGI
jgi:hypothetical protein